jgi:hypothetical protein
MRLLAWLVWLTACQPQAVVPTPTRVSVANPDAANEESEDAEFMLERDVPPPDHAVTPPLNFGSCLRSRMCQFEGFCTPNHHGQCIAATDDDCKPSDACLGGRCTAREGRCVAGSPEDCRDSWACKAWGRCTFDGGEACVATSEADCIASTRCRREGECVLEGDACVARRPRKGKSVKPRKR